MLGKKLINRINRLKPHSYSNSSDFFVVVSSRKIMFSSIFLLNKRPRANSQNPKNQDADHDGHLGLLYLSTW